MRSQSLPGEANRRRAEERFKSTKTSAKTLPQGGDALRQAEAAKTAGLRALRLAKEAADKDAADRDAATAAARGTERRRRAPKPQVSSPLGSE